MKHAPIDQVVILPLEIDPEAEKFVDGLVSKATANETSVRITRKIPVTDESSELTEEQVKAVIKRLEECMVVKDNPLAKYEAENVLLEIKVKEYKPKYDGIWRMDIT